WTSSITQFGQKVASALLVSAYVLPAELNRRRMQLERLPGYKAQRDEGFVIIGIAGIAGIVGARLYHVLESPSELFADPAGQLVSRFGFAWFGGLLGGTLSLVILGRRVAGPLLGVFRIFSAAGLVG